MCAKWVEEPKSNRELLIVLFVHDSVGVQKATRSMKDISPLFHRYFHSAYVLVRVA